MMSYKVSFFFIFAYIFIGGCTTGPIRSTTLGHKEYAIVNWTKDSSTVVKPFAVVGGLLTDGVVVVADTTVKSVNNVFVRPAVDVFEFGINEDILLASSIGTVCIFPIFFPVCSLSATLATPNEWDLCFGNATDRKIRFSLAEKQPVAAYKIVENGFGRPPRDPDDSTDGLDADEIKDREERLLQEWRLNWFTEIDEKEAQVITGAFQEVKELMLNGEFAKAAEECKRLDAHSFGCQVTHFEKEKADVLAEIEEAWATDLERVLRVRVEQLISKNQYESAKSACEAFNVEMISSQQERLKEARDEMLSNVFAQQYNHFEAAFLQEVAKLIEKKAFAQAIAFCDNFDYRQVMTNKQGLNEIVDSKQREVESLWCEQIKKDLDSRLTELLNAQKWKEAKDVCASFDVHIIPSCQQELQEHVDNLLADIGKQEIQEYESKLNQIVKEGCENKDFEFALKRCKEVSCLLSIDNYAEIVKIRDAAIGDIDDARFNYEQKNAKIKIDKLLEKREYEDALTLCSELRFLPDWIHNKNTITRYETQWSDFINGKVYKIREEWLSQYENKLREELSEALNRNEFGSALLMCLETTFPQTEKLDSALRELKVKIANEIRDQWVAHCEAVLKSKTERLGTYEDFMRALKYCDIVEFPVIEGRESELEKVRRRRKDQIYNLWKKPFIIFGLELGKPLDWKTLRRARRIKVPRLIEDEMELELSSAFRKFTEIEVNLTPTTHIIYKMRMFCSLSQENAKIEGEVVKEIFEAKYNIKFQYKKGLGDDVFAGKWEAQALSYKINICPHDVLGGLSVTIENLDKDTIYKEDAARSFSKDVNLL